MEERLDMLGGLLVCGNREGKDGSRGFYLLAKLNLRDRTQLAIWAVQTGVIYGSMEG